MNDARDPSLKLDAETLAAMHAADIADVFEHTTADQTRPDYERPGRREARRAVGLPRRERARPARPAEPRRRSLRWSGRLNPMTPPTCSASSKSRPRLRCSRRSRMRTPKRRTRRLPLHYPDDTAGAPMQAEIASITYNATAAGALEALRQLR